jgi:hypothetical protein
MSVELTGISGRTYVVDDAEPDHQFGRVYYRVRNVGTFTVEHDDSLDDGAVRVHLHYGRHDTGRVFGRDVLPETPVLFGIHNLTGGWIFTPSAYDNATRPPAASAARSTGPYSSVPAPDRTCRRLGDIGVALARDFLARPDGVSLALARAKYLAPGRISTLRQRLSTLDEEIATRRREQSLIEVQLGLQISYLDAELPDPQEVPSGVG